MKASAKTPKVPVLETILGLVAVGLVGFTLWYVWQANRQINTVYDQAEDSINSEAVVPKSNLTVTTSKLPTGWQVSGSTASKVVLSSKDNACTASVAYNPENAQGSASGIAATKLGTTQQNLQTSSGTVPVEATVTRIGTGAAVRYQSFGTIANNVQKTTVSADCSSRAQLTVAADAVQAITVNQKLNY